MAAASGQTEEGITDINITPLVDICLVLVIIFMAIAPFALTIGIKVLESRAKAGQGKASADENVQVRLDALGRITVNGVPVRLEVLPGELARAIASSRDKMVILTADEANRVGHVVEILDTARQAGAQKLAILKEEKQASGGGS